MRPSDHQPDQLRPVTLTRKFTRHVEGSVLVCLGDTRVLRTVSVSPKVPSHKKGSDEGWVAAECGVPPRSTHTRSDRKATRGKQSGRTQEIQRLVGRAMRTVFDLRALGEHTLHLGCDVLQAGGSTRTASVTGAFVTAYGAVSVMHEKGQLVGDPVRDFVAAVSVGMVDGVLVLDLDCPEDSACDTDMNVVMTGSGGFVEVQGTTEGTSFSRAEMNAMLGLADQGVHTLISLQKQALGL